MHEMEKIFKDKVLDVYTKVEGNTISFTLQEGPIKENGVNGTQIDNVVECAADIIRHFNDRFPCRENSLAITKLEEARHWLEHRTKNREARGVEGKNEQ